MQSDLFDAEYNSILAATSYRDFHGKLKAYDCRRCTMCHSRNQIVIDRGDPETPIMLISERPGDKEDLVGKPFVGRAGDLLRRRRPRLAEPRPRHRTARRRPEADAHDTGRQGGNRTPRRSAAQLRRLGRMDDRRLSGQYPAARRRGGPPAS